MSMDSRASTPSLPPTIGDYDASIIHHYRRAPSPHSTIAGPSSVSSRDQSETPRAYTPTAASSLASYPSRPKYARSASTATSTSRSRARSQRAEVLDLIMAEEDRQRSRLQEANDTLVERLEHEIRRADSAEHRAQYAESRARDAQSKAQSYATAQHQADVEITRLQEEAKRFRAQLEGANRELARAHAELDALEQQRTDAERGAASARETARQARAALEAQRAREAGLLEGRRIGLEEGMRGYLRESGGLPPASPRANAESARAAFQRGRARGYEEGRLAGAQTERQKAVAAFDRFLADHEHEMPELMQDQKSLLSFGTPRA